jgi:hypothetical protein
MTRLRMRVAERLKGAQNTYAMLSTFNEVDMTNIMALRNTYKVGRGGRRGWMSGRVGGVQVCWAVGRAGAAAAGSHGCSAGLQLQCC